MVERVDIVVNERGSRRVRRNIEGIGTASLAANSSVQLLRTALGLLGSAVGLRGAVGTIAKHTQHCLLYTSPSPRDRTRSRMPSSA